ncbi:hypothetical protein ULMS_03000 [Patiriisocius marinistellae]|uniref:Thioredoxin domain-containing protein n=1 Tax=Patiriisocius marinistellae TaxID=2494560 RepID=A0A5J4FUU1_9FLAO|nr:TlpA disulfide reductase family protein [Patiriisocius marinistellae]GEQ84792.1 hypothetical protein ULMS_03000 [Patiriisocius marinistellae]
MKTLLLTIIYTICVMTAAFPQEENAIQITDKTIIKDIDGTQISIDDFVILMDSKEYSIEPKKDANGAAYIQIVQLTKNQLNNNAKVASRIEEFTGGTLPPFYLFDSNENVISTENTKGKVVVFNFWFTSCPPCIQELPELNEVYEKYKNNKEIVFAAITFERAPKIEKFLKNYDLKYPIVPQQGGFSQKVSRGSYPTNVIVKKDGTVQEYISGGIKGIGKQIEAAIEAAL